MPTTAKKAAKAATAPFTASAPFEAFNFAAPSFDVPASVREFAEKSVTSARDAYANSNSDRN